jgi:predicted nucleotidyltransferase
MFMNTLDEIKFSLSNLKSELNTKYPIKSLAIFGSFARNEQSVSSDLDLVVEFTERVGMKFIRLGDELEEKLGIKVDLVSKNGVKKAYFDSIKEDLIYV